MFEVFGKPSLTSPVTLASKTRVVTLIRACSQRATLSLRRSRTTDSRHWRVVWRRRISQATSSIFNPSKVYWLRKENSRRSRSLTEWRSSRKTNSKSSTRTESRREWNLSTRRSEKSNRFCSRTDSKGWRNLANLMLSWRNSMKWLTKRGQGHVENNFLRTAINTAAIFFSLINITFGNHVMGFWD